jgi:hypothetical protein
MSQNNHLSQRQDAGPSLKYYRKSLIILPVKSITTTAVAADFFPDAAAQV